MTHEQATTTGTTSEAAQPRTKVRHRPVLQRLILIAFARARRMVRTDENFLILLAVAVGIAGALSVIGFRLAVEFIRQLVWGAASHLSDYVVGVPWWRVLLVPTLGGIAVGLWKRYALPGQRAYGVTDVVYAAVDPKARLRSRQSLSTAFGGAVSIGTGASIGREGVMVQLGAAMTVSLCRRLRLTPALSRALMGAGIAAVMAAQFNAPLAGTFFALELVLRDYLIRSLAPTVVAAVTGTAISRWWWGDFPAFQVPRHYVQFNWEYVAFAVLGLIAGCVAMGFMKNGEIASRLFRRYLPNRILRPAVGGLSIGLLALAVPNVLGTGYGTITGILTGSTPTLSFLLALLVAKSMATSISVGSGFIGGDFSASLLLGAATGAIFNQLLGFGLGPAALSQMTVYSMIGMGAVTAAVMGAPMTTILIIFEMTADYSITAGVMIAVVISTMLVNSFYGGSIVQWKLENRI